MRPYLLPAAVLFLGFASAANVPHGKAIYQTNCAGCHGAKAQGNIGPTLVGEVAGWAPALFQRALLKSLDDKGAMLKAPMPQWGKIGFKGDKGKAPTTAELQDLQAYLKTFK
ncbi:cytochrome c [Deinococcus sp.]|uniref:c-type cytochrome n=1 Tax=Deinococcus sp. TaxID=47478 RepID=UPI0025F94A43|nr:cytochrome c [Deinococcus sp.]